MSNVPARVAADSAQADADLAALAASLSEAVVPAANDGNPPAPAPVEVPPAPAPAPVEPVDATTLQRMQAQLESMEGRYQRGQQELDRARADLEAARAAPPAAPTPAPAPVPNAITPTDVTEFGEDTIGMVRRVFADESRGLRDEIRRLSEQLSGMQGNVQRAQQTAQTAAQGAQQTRAERYVQALDSTMPSWRDTNVDPLFERWLDQKDPASGARMGDLLSEAHNALDSGRVIAIFTRYKPELANGNPPAAANPADPKRPTVDPTSQVAPNTTAATAAPPSQTQGRIFDSAEFDKAHEDMLKKRISKEQYDAIEREYYAAVADGRVRISP